jgi:hypothetical protein
MGKDAAGFPLRHLNHSLLKYHRSNTGRGTSPEVLAAVTSFTHEIPSAADPLSGGSRPPDGSGLPEVQVPVPSPDK